MEYSEEQESVLRWELGRVQARLHLAQSDLQGLMERAFRDPEKGMLRFEEQAGRNLNKTLKHFSKDGAIWMAAEGYPFLRGSAWSLSPNQRQEREDALAALRQVPATVTEIAEARERVNSAELALRECLKKKAQANGQTLTNEGQKPTRENSWQQRVLQVLRPGSGRSELLDDQQQVRAGQSVTQQSVVVEDQRQSVEQALRPEGPVHKLPGFDDGEAEEQTLRAEQKIKPGGGGYGGNKL